MYPFDYAAEFQVDVLYTPPQLTYTYIRPTGSVHMDEDKHSITASRRHLNRSPAGCTGPRLTTNSALSSSRAAG